MSVLAWLFGLGAAAVVFPILFHLIRRTPQGRTEFSSLMFLRSSPPTLTRRSQLDNLLLLLLRAAIVCLLAFAFMRPFFRGASELADFDVEHRRVAVLLDVSASMRRDGVFEKAKTEVLKTLDQLEPKDQVAFFTFDAKVKTVVGFDESDQVDVASQELAVTAIKKELSDLTPGWARADLGGAIVAIANDLESWQDTERSDQTGRRPKLQVYVVSDMQASSETESLQAYQWPPMVKVKFQPVSPPIASNATVELLAQVTDEIKPSIRVRVTNHADAIVSGGTESFNVNWQKADSNEAERKELSFLVAPGTSRVQKLPLGDAMGVSKFSLDGDQQRFDNEYFLAPSSPQTLSLLYIGDEDGNDPESLLFFLARVFSKTPSRSFDVWQLQKADLQGWQTDDFSDAKLISQNGEVVIDAESESLAQPTLVVLNAAVNSQTQEKLESLVMDGVWVVAMADQPALLRANGRWIGAEPKDATKQTDYQIFGQMELTDPMLAPFRDPNFSDFTAVQFWRSQTVAMIESSNAAQANPEQADSEVVVWFDNRRPAIWKRKMGEGQIVGFSFGWRPQDSQFAMSPKFVALFKNLLELAAAFPELEQSTLVSQPLQFPASEKERSMFKPNGVACVVEPGATRFRFTREPGIYELRDEEDPTSESLTFAVNLDRRESDPRRLALEQLERMGVQVGLQKTASSELDQLRELRDREIEGSQKVWKWAIAAVLLLLVVETLYAGRKAAQAASANPAPS